MFCSARTFLIVKISPSGVDVAMPYHFPIGYPRVKAFDPMQPCVKASSETHDQVGFNH